MGVPVTYYWFMRNGSATGSNGMYELSTVAPPFSFLANASGWIIGTNASPNFMDMDFQTEVPRTTVQASPYTTLNTGTNTGNAMRTDKFHGDFDGARWCITQSVKSNTSGVNGRGFLVFRVWASTDPTGANARLITGSYFSSSVSRPLNPSASSVLSASFALGPFTVNDEYIFIHEQYAVVTAGGAVGNDCDLFIGPNSQSHVTASLYISHPPSGCVFYHDEYPAP